ncbi:MAG: metallophosphatase [Bacteroidia bacterium]
MKRKEFIRDSIALGAGLAFAPSLLKSCTSKSTSLTILHTNDMHSRIEPFPSNAGRNAGLGGMARRATLIKQIRAETENVLLLDSGDIFQGTPYFNFFGGELEFKLMSQMGYDVATLGNHDFDNGLVGLEKMLPNANFSFVNANYDFSKTILKDRFKPYKIIDKGDIKVGVFGLGIELKGLVPDKLYAETQYNEPISVAKEIVAELQTQNCDYIICLSHLGFKNDSEKVDDHKLAESVNGIDLILGGHTHTFLNEPIVYENVQGHKTIINQVGWAGINLGRIDVNFGPTGAQNFASKVMPVSFA